MIATRAYSSDLAYVHDAGFCDFVRAAGRAVLPMLPRASEIGGPVVDLGCGSGVWAAQLCDAGYKVVGVDISRAMIALAKRRAPRATFRVKSAWRVTLPTCGAVTAFGEVLNYRFDRSTGGAALRRLFGRVYRALRPGGLFIFDQAGPGRAHGPPVRFREGEDWLVVARVSESRSRTELTRKIITLRRRGGGYRRSDETHVLRLYLHEEVMSWLRAAGFRVRMRRAYGSLPLGPGYAAFFCRKPRERGNGRTGRSAMPLR